ncbi:MAG: hypothetical protein ACAH79_07420 [Thermoleophilia bacterium]
MWLVAALAVGASAWLYLSEFWASTGVMGVDRPGSWGSGEGPPPETWFLDAMLSLRQPYAFPGSILTALDAVWILVPLGAYLAVVTIGPDFWWGTMRTILVTRRSRVAYLALRLSMILIVVAGSLLAVLAAASISQVALVGLAGERFPSGSLRLDTFGAMLGARAVAALGYALMAALLTLLARSLVGGVVLVATAAAGEIAVGALATSLGAPLVRELTFSGALSSIVGQLRPPPLDLVVDYEAGALIPAAHQLPPSTYGLSLEASSAVVIIWVFVVAALAFTRMRAIDISE